MRKKPRSIAVILISGIVILSTLFISSLGFTFWKLRHRDTINDFLNHSSSASDQLATALSYPVWNFDETYVKKIVEGALLSKDIRGIRLARPAFDELIAVRKADGFVSASFADFEPVSFITETRNIVYGGNSLGVVDVYFSTAELERANRHFIYLVIALVMIFNAFLVISLYALLWRLALKPLGAIEDYAMEVSSGRDRVSIAGGGFPAELENLRGSIERMVNLLKRRMEEIAQSERKIHTIFNGASDLIIVRQAKGSPGAPSSISEVNDITCEKLGYTRNELLRMDYSELFPDSGKVFTGGNDPLAESGAGRRTAHMRKKDGDLLPLEVMSQNIELDGIGYVIEAGRDISERIKAEEEREKLEDQLRQAHKMEAIGRLAGGVAHDFNNLLTAILGYCELIDMTLHPDTEMKAYLSQITSASNRAASLTQQLLAFSRKQILQPKTIRLGDVVEETHKILERIVGEDIHLVLRIAPDAGFIYADPGQISQVLMNLTINARDAMPKGGKLVIEISNFDNSQINPLAPTDMTPGQYVQLTVSDTGVGMDASVKTKLFEPFFTTKGLGRGTGLGLATVHGIVTQSGGFISVQSEPGKGSAFRIYFPRSREGKAAIPFPEAGLTTFSGGSETILLVEDSPDVLNLTTNLLTGMGYAIHRAATGEDALKLFDELKGDVDLLLTDVVMPGISGRELAQELTARKPGLKVLYMSGYTEDAIINHGVVEKGLNFMNKPFRPAELAAKIREVLSAGGVAPRVS